MLRPQSGLVIISYLASLSQLDRALKDFEKCHFNYSRLVNISNGIITDVNIAIGDTNLIFFINKLLLFVIDYVTDLMVSTEYRTFYGKLILKL